MVAAPLLCDGLEKIMVCASLQCLSIVGGWFLFWVSQKIVSKATKL
jgi:hypothetical protein